MTRFNSSENGNILFYVLIGIVLVGLLTVALRNTSGYKENIDSEGMVLKSSEIQRYGDELARAVNILMDKKVSEADIRFAHPDASSDYGTITTNPGNQIFSTQGGQATYKLPPAGISDGSPWEFFATSKIPQVGSDRAELIAVLPHVTQSFCQTINSQLGFTSGTQPTDDAAGSPACVMGSSSNRFTGSYSDTSPNPLDGASFSKLPAYQACVYCASSSTYNYYYVLLSR